MLYSNTASEAHSLAQSELMFSEPEKRKSGLDKVNDGLRNFLKELRAMSADRIRSASQNRGKPLCNLCYYFNLLYRIRLFVLIRP